MSLKPTAIVNAKKKNNLVRISCSFFRFWFRFYECSIERFPETFLGSKYECIASIQGIVSSFIISRIHVWEWEKNGIWKHHQLFGMQAGCPKRRTVVLVPHYSVSNEFGSPAFTGKYFTSSQNFNIASFIVVHKWVSALTFLRSAYKRSNGMYSYLVWVCVCAE